MIELAPAQLEAISKMKNGCILCGGVGSGKSRTSLGYYYQLYGGDLRSNDYVEMIDPSDLIIITTAQKRDKHEWDIELALYLMSTNPERSLYKNTVIVDSWQNIDKYVTRRGCFFIFDEQRLTGKGVWAKSFIKISKQNSWILVSATPADRWEDYATVFVANGFFRNRTEFYDSHIIMDYRGTYPKLKGYIGETRLIRLRDSILIDIPIQRTTTQHHVNISCPYDRALYRRVVRERFNYEKNKPFESSSEYCHFLRKIVNSDPSRGEFVLQKSREINKIIVFYRFDFELDTLLSLNYDPDIVVAQWNGHVHNAVPDAKRWIYLVQYTSGCEGWNCIETDTIIFYCNDYSYKVMTQASGRIDRLNTQFLDLHYYHLTSTAPIDVMINRALEQKKNFNMQRFYKK